MAQGQKAPAMKDPGYGGADQIMSLPEAKLIAILKDPSATEFAKAKACQRLAVVGSRESVPALAALLSDERLAHYARTGLEPMPAPEAGEALRAALPKLKGRVLVGVIDSLGVRRDAKALDALSKLMYDADPAVARAASAALGRIRPGA